MKSVEAVLLALLLTNFVRYNYKNWKFDTHLPIDNGLQDDEKMLYRVDQKSPKDWLEFQANVFAASLIMPREMFVLALKQTQKSIGIFKNVGRVYLSNVSSSHRDYETIVNQLSQTFSVSKKSINVRFRTLHLIEGENNKNNDQIYINPFTVLSNL